MKMTVDDSMTISIIDGITTVTCLNKSDQHLTESKVKLILDNCPNYSKEIIFNGVISIECSAFKNCNRFDTILLPNIHTIGFCSFKNSGVKHVRAPNVRVILKDAFNNCRQLKSFITNKRIIILQSNVFVDCTSLTSIVINTKIIPSYAFFNCSSLEIANISNLTTIKEYAFFGCSSLKSVSVPFPYVISNIKFKSGIDIDIDDNSFIGCSYIEEEKRKDEINHETIRKMTLIDYIQKVIINIKAIQNGKQCGEILQKKVQQSELGSAFSYLTDPLSLIMEFITPKGTVEQLTKFGDTDGNQFITDRSKKKNLK